MTQADRLLAEGKDVADVCRELGVAEQTYYRGRNQLGGLEADDAKKLKDLEREYATLSGCSPTLGWVRGVEGDRLGKPLSPGTSAGRRAPPHRR